MSEIKALEKLRRLAKEVVDARWGVEFDRVADALEAEIEERYMPLPLDADGEPIHVGDEITLPSGKRDTVRFITYRIADVVFNERGWVPNLCRHAKPRTVEDVLREFAGRVLNSGHQWGLDAETTTAECAAELRELMRDDA